jgi:hypothetical protein
MDNSNFVPKQNKKCLKKPPNTTPKERNKQTKEKKNTICTDTPLALYGMVMVQIE